MRLENRADAHDIQIWIAGFTLQELGKQGWTTSTLTALTADYPGLYLYSNSDLASCFIYQQIDKNHYEVLFLGTAKNFRKKGFQERLITHFFKLHTGAELWLECRSDNQAAISLYKKMGFSITGTRTRYYKDGMDAILMAFLPQTEQ